MISKKMLEFGRHDSVIRHIAEYSKNRREEIGADKVYDFSIGNPSVPVPQKVHETVLKLLTERDLVDIHGYTAAVGDNAARAAVARAYSAESGTEIPASLIYMTCGAAASLTITLHAIVNPGDEIIVLAPFFPEYSVYIDGAGAKQVVANTAPNTFKIDIDELAGKITPKTKAIIINSPNNPTGVVYSEAELQAVADLLREKQAEYGTDIFIIADEPYRKLVYGGVKVPYITELYDNTVVCYSYSKALSLPGERIGYILVSPKTEYADDLFAAVCGAGRTLGFICATSLFQHTIAQCADAVSDVSVYEENRNLLYNALTDIGYETASPDGAFYLFVKALEDDANAFAERAKKHELLFVPSDSFGCEGYVRIAYCVSTDTVKRSIPAFKSLYNEYNN